MSGDRATTAVSATRDHTETSNASVATGSRDRTVPTAMTRAPVILANTTDDVVYAEVWRVAQWFSI